MGKAWAQQEAEFMTLEGHRLTTLTYSSLGHRIAQRITLYKPIPHLHVSTPSSDGNDRHVRHRRPSKAAVEAGKRRLHMRR